MKTFDGLVALAFLVGSGAYAQSLVGAGYGNPAIVRIAPGQAVPLIVAGLTPVLGGETVVAPSIPLPTTLAGISVVLSQTPGYSRTLPIFSVYQFNLCAAASAECALTAIMVQIPFDLPIPPGAEPPINNQPITSVMILENGAATKSFLVTPVSTQIHAIQSCDLGSQDFANGGCFALVTHLDGTLVLQDDRSPGQPPLTHSEAMPGEVITMYAFGLGQVTPAVQAGASSPTPAAVVTQPIYLQFDYRPNASPSMPTLSSSLTVTSQPLFVGLTPGLVGLYQINFVIPAPPAGTAVCGSPVESNLTVSIASSDGQSFSGDSICVDTGAQ